MDTDREIDVQIARHITKLKNINQAGPDDMIFTIHRDFIDPGDYWYDVPDGGYDAVPHYGEDEAVALGMITQFTEQHGAWFSVGTVPPPMRRKGYRYMCSIQGGTFVYFTSTLTQVAYARTPALAMRQVVLEVLLRQSQVE